MDSGSCGPGRLGSFRARSRFRAVLLGCHPERSEGSVVFFPAAVQLLANNRSSDSNTSHWTSATRFARSEILQSSLSPSFLPSQLGIGANTVISLPVGAPKSLFRQGLLFYQWTGKRQRRGWLIPLW